MPPLFDPTTLLPVSLSRAEMSEDIHVTLWQHSTGKNTICPSLEELRSKCWAATCWNDAVVHSEISVCWKVTRQVAQECEENVYIFVKKMG